MMEFELDELELAVYSLDEIGELEEIREAEAEEKLVWEQNNWDWE